MFCGELSIFAPGFAEKVNTSLKCEEDKLFDPINRLYSSLNDFLSNKSNSLTVLLQNKVDDFLEGSKVKKYFWIMKELKYILSNQVILL